MNEIIDHYPSRKQRLLTGAQRKALENRVRTHAKTLEWEYRKDIESENEPSEVAKARAVVEKWEAGQDAKIERVADKLRDEVKQITRNLLFDSVESSLLQVDDFEERCINDFAYLALPNAEVSHER